MKYSTLPARLAVWCIRLYQKTFSPDHGMMAGHGMIGCRYYPSCSEYTARSIDRFGLIKGGLFGVWRIIRCNPWSQGGVDEVPLKK